MDNEDPPSDPTSSERDEGRGLFFPPVWLVVSQVVLAIAMLLYGSLFIDLLDGVLMVIGGLAIGNALGFLGLRRAVRRHMSTVHPGAPMPDST
jgi:hypothetical protein